MLPDAPSKSDGPIPEVPLDLIIVGGGIGGVICLKYALDAGLRTLLLEREDGVGGLWRDLPEWQDIQFRKEEWTLGDLPIEGEKQPSILRNIEAWVERFDLAPRIRLGAEVRRAEPREGGWRVTTQGAQYDSDWLIAATGAHNRPVIPSAERLDSTIRECHSSELRDPDSLHGKRVTVVGGGASAYDLLDLCFDQGATSVAWVHRSTRWMRPTLQPKHLGTDLRFLAKLQLLGRSTVEINRRINEDLRRRYAKAGIEDIMPHRDFDLRRDQLVPGRRVMVANFEQIDRFESEVRRLEGNEVHLEDGRRLDTDVLLWATGYDMNLSYLNVDALRHLRDSGNVAERCYSGFRSRDAENLFILAPAILETTTSAPWAYAHVARSMMAHIGGSSIFDDAAEPGHTNHIDLVKQLAKRDRKNFTRGLWWLRYLARAFLHPRSKPLPIP